MQAHARPDLATPDLLELLSLDDDAFKRRFKALPSCARNVAAFCAMSASPWETSVTPPLFQHCTVPSSDPEPLIAEHARWAIEQIEKRSRQN